MIKIVLMECFESFAHTQKNLADKLLQTAYGLNLRIEIIAVELVVPQEDWIPVSRVTFLLSNLLRLITFFTIHL